MRATLICRYKEKYLQLEIILFNNMAVLEYPVDSMMSPMEVG